VKAELILVRHAQVAGRYSGRCYGRSNVELSPAGRRRSRELSALLARHRSAAVIHSGLCRSTFLAELLSSRLGADCRCCPELCERDFGDWELKPWQNLYQRHGDEMLRIITEPETYRPGGGETTFEVRDRVLRWFRGLSRAGGVTIAVTHGGPIATLRGVLLGRPVADWIQLIPRCGESVSIDLNEAG
jgi:broad specificity phosphatase PhoE